jgi:hypothetical protein
MRYIEEQHAWLADPLPGSQVEILIAGSAGAANAGCVALLSRIRDELFPLEASARGHLREYLKPSLLETLSTWTVEAVEVGCGEARRDDQAAMILSDSDDTYGQWSVTFQYSGGRFFPVAFSRRQI